MYNLLVSIGGSSLVFLFLWLLIRKITNAATIQFGILLGLVAVHYLILEHEQLLVYMTGLGLVFVVSRIIETFQRGARRPT